MRELSRRLFGFGISSASKCVLSYELSVPYRTLHDRKQGSQRFFLIPVRCASAARIQPEETSSMRNLPRARRSLNEPTRDWKAARTLPSWSVVCTEDVPRVSPEFGRFPGQADSQDCEKWACRHTTTIITSCVDTRQNWHATHGRQRKPFSASTGAARAPHVPNPALGTQTKFKPAYDS